MRTVELKLELMDKLMTPTELAELCGVPLKTLYQWRYRGVGPAAVAVGRHIRYRPSDVDRWLDEQTKGGDPRND